MPRLSTRMKRKKDLVSSQQHRFWKGNVEGRKRMKSFPTAQRAKEWAKEQKIDEKIYELAELSKEKFQWKKKNKYLA